MAIGLLIVEFRGVYRAGHRAELEARYMAAVKACGDGAVLSGLAAAWFWGLIKGPPPQRSPLGIGADQKGYGARRRHMDPKDATVHRGIPITTVPVTLISLPSLLSFEDLAERSMRPTFATAPAPSTSRPPSSATQTPPAARP